MEDEYFHNHNILAKGKRGDTNLCRRGSAGRNLLTRNTTPNINGFIKHFTFYVQLQSMHNYATSHNYFTTRQMLRGRYKMQNVNKISCLDEKLQSVHINLNIIEVAMYVYCIMCVRWATPKRLMSPSLKSQVMFASAFS